MIIFVVSVVSFSKVLRNAVKLDPKVEFVKGDPFPVVVDEQQPVENTVSNPQLNVVVCHSQAVLVVIIESDIGIVCR